MSLWVKVCGITEVASAIACVEAGADAIGLVLTSSPRRVALDRALEIADSVRGQVQLVAVFRRPSADDIRTARDELGPDLIQGDHDSLPMLDGADYLPVYREGSASAPPVVRFLYEGPVSGVGQSVELSIAAELATTGDMVLAGGLSPDNVADVIEIVRPVGVDVSSGVEKSPGVKDGAMIREFVAAARAHDDRALNR